MRTLTTKKKYVLRITNVLMVLLTQLSVKEGIFAEKELKLKNFVRLDLMCLSPSMDS